MKFPNTTMSKFKMHILVTSGLAILVLTISVLSRGDTNAQAPRDCPGVSICNTDAQPIPVRWSGTESAPVYWTGTAKVEVTNVDAQPIPVSPQGVTQVGGRVDVGSPVSIKTTPREPIYVALAPAPESFFYAQGTVGLRPGDNSVLFSPPGFEVPAGKILRLQHVSADIDMGHQHQVPHVSLKAKIQPWAPPITIPLVEVQNGASLQWSINQSLPPVPLQPGTQIEILFQRNHYHGQATLTLVLTGELFDAP